MKSFAAVGSLVVLAVLVLAKGVGEPRLLSALERKLSERLGTEVSLSGIGLNLGGLEARGLRLGDFAAIDTLTIGWREVSIDGGEVVLDHRLVPQKPSPGSTQEGVPEGLPRVGLEPARLRFENVALFLSSAEGKTKLATLGGDVFFEEGAGNGRLSAVADSLRVDGRFSLDAADRPKVLFDGAFDIRALGVEWEPLSRSPIRADARLELAGRWDGATLGISRGSLRSGPAGVEWTGNLALAPEGPRFDLDVRLPPTECQSAIDAIPQGVLGEYSGFVLEGALSGDLHLRLAPERPQETGLQISVKDGCRFRRAPPAAQLDRLRKPFLHQAAVDRDTIVAFETGPSSPDWVTLEDVSPFFLHAALAQEDARFFAHEGFLADAFETALARNLEEGRFAAGGSTISMQLARNLFLVREKTLSRKIQEALLTWWLEKSLSKQEILELYVNLIEFGPGLYGIGPASRHYFGCPSESLSPAEAAFLATLLPAPSKRHRDYERGQLSSWGRARVEQLLRRMWERGRIDQRALVHGLAQVPRMVFHYGPEPRLFRHEDIGSAALLPVW